MGDIIGVYGSSTAFTVTNLHSIATSATLLAGWTSAGVDNTSSPALDFAVSGQITVNNSSAPTDNTQIQLWFYAAYEATPTWPDIFSAGTEGTEGTATVHDANRRNSGLVRAWSTTVGTTTGAVYTIPEISVARTFGLLIAPENWACFITHNTGQNLHSSGNVLYYKTIKQNVA